MIGDTLIWITEQSVHYFAAGGHPPHTFAPLSTPFTGSPSQIGRLRPNLDPPMQKTLTYCGHPSKPPRLLRIEGLFRTDLSSKSTVCACSGSGDSPAASNLRASI